MKKHVRNLDINGVLTTDSLKILNKQKRFYQELYQSTNGMSNNNETITLFLDNLNIPKLSETEKNSCEGKISVSTRCKNKGSTSKYYSSQSNWIH